VNLASLLFCRGVRQDPQGHRLVLLLGSFRYARLPQNEERRADNLKDDKADERRGRRADEQQ
jgi:hypothetical protein